MMSNSHEPKSVPQVLCRAALNTAFNAVLFLVVLPYFYKVANSMGLATVLSMAAFLVWITVWAATISCNSRSRAWMWFLALWCGIQVSMWVVQAQGKDPNEVMKEWISSLPHLKKGVNNLEDSVDNPKGATSSESKAKDGAPRELARPTTATPSKPSPPPLEKVPYEGKDTESLSID